MADSGSSSTPLLLVWGDDEFAVKQRARQLYQNWTQEAGGFDHEIIDAAAGNVAEALSALGRLREALGTLPFFGSSKVVWFQNCNFLGDDRISTSPAVADHLLDLVEVLKKFSWQNVRLLISAGKVDRRKSFYKTLDKIGRTETFGGWSYDDRDWSVQAEATALEHLRSLGKQIDSEALSALVESVGPNSRQLHEESEKLALYVGNRERIAVQDVDAIVTRNKQSRAFALGDALGARDLSRLLRTLDEELWEVKISAQKSEIGLLYGLIGKLRSLLMAKELLAQKLIRPEQDFNRFKAQLARISPESMPQDKRFNPLQTSPYVLFKAAGQAAKYTMDELVQGMETLLQCNAQLIFSDLDESLVLQRALVKIVQGNSTEPLLPKT